jgi:DNA-binding response OmpR family regulator
MRILIIEDSRDLAVNIGEFMEARGHVPDFAADGVTGLHLACVNDYEAIILDLMLPALDGLDLCKKLRRDARKDTPVLMLTARDTLQDKLDGFSAGGDDYLVKPFALQELEARLLALSRRGASTAYNRLLKVSDLEYDLDTMLVKRGGRVLMLTPTARKILGLLMRAQHRVVSREEIEQEIWGEHPPEGDVLRAHIYAIRTAIDKPFTEKLLHTVHGSGYRLARMQQP